MSVPPVYQRAAREFATIQKYQKNMFESLELLIRIL